MAELFLVEFKGSRKDFFYNKFHHSLRVSDHVIVEAERGEDIGVLIQRIDPETNFTGPDRPGSILRPASKEDLAKVEELRGREHDYKYEVIEFITRHGLPMKVVDVECQFDWNKLTVYFTADHRVDFRELVKDLAGRYRTRIELRQIGVRDEARRIGGYGVCGLRQCCNTFIRDFAPITTHHAREQGLPLNPAKISGNCGRLLCCLRYESGVYSQVREMFPSVGTFVESKHGEGRIEHIDIFNEEAVIRDEQNLLFRSSAADIVSVSGKREPAEAPVDTDFGERIDEDEVSEEELRKLDDVENGR